MLAQSSVPIEYTLIVGDAMKKLLVAFSLMFTLGVSAPPAKAWFSIQYPGGEFSEVYPLGGGNLAFVYYCWSSYNNNCYWWDVYTAHSNGAGTPISVSIAPGAPPGQGYYLSQTGYDFYYAYYEAYYTNNWGLYWYYIGPYLIPW